MHFILEVELKDPPTAPGLALADDKADNGTYKRSKNYVYWYGGAKCVRNTYKYYKSDV